MLFLLIVLLNMLLFNYVHVRIRRLEMFLDSFITFYRPQEAANVAVKYFMESSFRLLISVHELLRSASRNNLFG